MSERTGLRYGLLGLIVIALLAALAYFVARPTQTPAAAHAAAVEENQLQSLKDVAKQAPVHRKLDIQEWKTAEGAKVLFVEAHELPMFDLRLTFAAGSSQDAGTPGLSMLTNAMLNEACRARTPLPSPPASRTSAPRSATAPTATWRWPACAACPMPTSGPRR